MTITLTPDTTGAPFVRVDVDAVPTEAATLTVWRTANGREIRVRGMVAVAADGASGLDYEAPIGWESSYRAQYFDAGGEFIGWSDPETVTLPVTGADYAAWFHNPLDPTTAVRVELQGQGRRSLTRPIPAEVLRPASRSVGVVIFRGPRMGYQGLVLDCVTLSAEDDARFDALFGGYDDTTIPILCIRAAPASMLPPTLFTLITEPSRAPVDAASYGGQMPWELSGDEVAPPAEALVAALLSYADFTAFYSDYDAFTAAYIDYTEATRDYSIAGTA